MSLAPRITLAAGGLGCVFLSCNKTSQFPFAVVPLIHRDTLQGLLQMPETVDSTEPCMYYAFFLYTHNCDEV